MARNARRVAIMAAPLPRSRWLPIVAASMLVVTALISNAAGYPYRPTMGLVAFAATQTLACGAMIFALALGVACRDNSALKPTAKAQ